jgi:hypothetical protein
VSSPSTGVIFKSTGHHASVSSQFFRIDSGSPRPAVSSFPRFLNSENVKLPSES